MLEQKRLLEARLGRLPQAERPPPLAAERNAAELAAELEEEQEDGGTHDSHVPPDAEIAGIREKAALWHTPASSTARRCQTPRSAHALYTIQPLVELCGGCMAVLKVS
jgi:hypothetical protein